MQEAAEKHDRSCFEKSWNINEEKVTWEKKRTKRIIVKVMKNGGKIYT